MKCKAVQLHKRKDFPDFSGMFPDIIPNFPGGNGYSKFWLSMQFLVYKENGTHTSEYSYHYLVLKFGDGDSIG